MVDVVGLSEGHEVPGAYLEVDKTGWEDREEMHVPGEGTIPGEAHTALLDDRKEKSHEGLEARNEDWDS